MLAIIYSRKENIYYDIKCDFIYLFILMLSDKQLSNSEE